MKLSLSQLAQLLGLAFKGDDVELSGVSSLEKAGPGDLTFLAQDKYLPQFAATKAGAVIVEEKHAGGKGNYLISPQPQLDFAKVLHHIAVPQGEAQGVHELAYVHPDAEIGENCDIFPFAYVGARAVIGANCRILPHAYVGEDCVMGEDCMIHPCAVMLSPTKIGNRVILHSGAVLGTDGFGFAPTPDGVVKIPQVGGIAIGDDVEIGALSAVDRATVGETTIAEQTKIDNHVQVAHNVAIGPQCLIAGHSAISGSSTLGRGVILAGRVGLVDHVSLGDGVIVGASSGVTKDIPAGELWAGLPAYEQRTYRRVYATIPKLPDMRKRLLDLEKEVAALKEQLTSEQSDSDS